MYLEEDISLTDTLNFLCDTQENIYAATFAVVTTTERAQFRALRTESSNDRLCRWT